MTIGSDERAAVVLLLAAWLDCGVGDPQEWLHPVQVIGWAIAGYSRWAIAVSSRWWWRRGAGVLLGVGLIGGTGALAWGMVWFASQVHWALGMAVEVVLLASCFAGRSLRAATMLVLEPLRSQDLVLARSQLSYYVGRDTANLPKSEILRATLETVAENTTDGVTGPLFYAIAGAFLPGVGSVPLALAYKAASTLDSMVGYRREPYRDLGWFSAKLEDCLTWLPCRLTVVAIALLGGQPGRVWQWCWRDGRKDPSPNAGWSECAFAATLGVQLGGKNFYQGVEKNKPLLGEPMQPITPEIIEQALVLMRRCFLLGLGLGVAGLSVIAIV